MKIYCKPQYVKEVKVEIGSNAFLIRPLPTIPMLELDVSQRNTEGSKSTVEGTRKLRPKKTIHELEEKKAVKDISAHHHL